MKNINIISFMAIIAVTLLTVRCNKELDKEALGTITQANLFNDPTSAIQAVNSIYDAASWDEGPKWGSGPYVGHMYEWMFGDIRSDDSEKGSTPSDFTAISDLKTWNADQSNALIGTLWTHCFSGIARANIVINNVETGIISESLKKQLKGEALFFRGYFYFYLVRTFGGVPLFDKQSQIIGSSVISRNSIAETYAFIEKDLKEAASLLPEKNKYPAADLGRATKGAANAYLARSILYQLGTINGSNHNWQELYDLTNVIISSDQYSLTPNYAVIQEVEGENNMESIFELQFATSLIANGPEKSGTTNNLIQNNRSTWGWGFNNPTQNLVNEFEPNDPRLPVTLYKDGDMVLGILNTINSSGNATGYLNRKAAILRPSQTKSGDQNIRKMRYADILLMKAEAAAKTGKESESIALVNQIRQRARNASKPKGSTLGSLAFDANTLPVGSLPDLPSTLTGQNLLLAIWHERRVEFGMEAIRFWDLIRTGQYFNTLSADVQSKCLSHSITQNSVYPLPLLPIPLNEVQTWKLQQNPGY